MSTLNEDIFHTATSTIEEDALVLTPEEPYAGLASFTEINKAFFYGRKREVEKVIKRVEQNLLTVVYGKSGIGKSSILRAGVFPELREKGFLPIDIKWDVLTDATKKKLDADEIYEAILSTVKGALDENNIDAEPDPRYTDFIDQNQETITSLKAQDKLWFYLNTNCFWDFNNNIIVPVILLDQFERLFTVNKGNVSFFRFLQMAVEHSLPLSLVEKEFDYLFNCSKARYKLLIGLQEDFLPDLSMFEKHIPTLLKSKYRLQPFKRKQAIDAILLPAEEKKLVEITTAEAIISYLVETETSGSNTHANADIPISRDEYIEVEPIFLSMVCKKLNNERIKQNKETITPLLLTESTEKNKLLKDFYEDILKEIVPDDKSRASLKKVIEDNLLTDAGGLDFDDEDGMVQKLSLEGMDGRAILDDLIKKRILRREPFLGKQRIYIIHNKLAKAVADERNERLLEERNKEEQDRLRKEQDRLQKAIEDAERDLELEKGKTRTLELQSTLQAEKRRKHRLILVFVFLIIVGVVFLVFFQARVAALSAQKKIDALESSMNKKRLANTQDSLIRVREEANAKASRDSLENEITKAKQKASQDSLKTTQHSLAKNRQLLQQKEELNKKLKASLDKNEQQTALLESKKDSLLAVTYKYEIADDIRRRNINSADLDTFLFQKVTNRLYSLKSNKDTIAYTKLLEAIGTALEARSSILSNTDLQEGFTKAKNVWENNKNTIIDSILLSYINKTLYYKQVINIKNNAGYGRVGIQSRSKSFLAFSGNRSDICFNYNNRIFTGNVYPDSISVNQRSSLLYDTVLASTFKLPRATYYSYYNSQINGLAYTENKDVLGIINNAFLIQWNSVKQQEVILKKLNLGNPSQVHISPDGNYLIANGLGNTYKLWRTSNLKEEKQNQENAILFDTTMDDVKSVKFSDDSKKALFLSRSGLTNVYNLSDYDKIKNVIPRIKNLGLPTLKVANFSSDGNWVIAFTTNGSVTFRNLEKPEKVSTNVPVPIKDSILSRYLSFPVEINSIFLSKNRKVILINTPSEALLCIAKNDAAFGNPLSANDITYKRLNISNDQNVSFVNDSLILSLNRDNKVFLWKIYPEFNTMSDFFKVVKVPTDQTLFQKVIVSGSEEEMVDLAEDFLDKYRYKSQKDIRPDTSYLNKAKLLYHKLMSEKNTSSFNEYAYRLISINKELVLQDTFLHYLDKYYSEMYDIAAKYKATFSVRSLSTFFGNQAWYKIKDGKFKAALAYAKKGIDADSTNDFVYTNLALGYLFNYDFVNAEKVYNNLKKEAYRDKSKSFSEAFEEDFKSLKEIGIIYNGNKTIDNEVDKIRREILKQGK